MGIIKNFLKDTIKESLYEIVENERYELEKFNAEVEFYSKKFSITSTKLNTVIDIPEDRVHTTYYLDPLCKREIRFGFFFDLLSRKIYLVFNDEFVMEKYKLVKSGEYMSNVIKFNILYQDDKNTMSFFGVLPIMVKEDKVYCIFDMFNIR